MNASTDRTRHHSEQQPRESAAAAASMPADAQPTAEFLDTAEAEAVAATLATDRAQAERAFAVAAEAEYLHGSESNDLLDEAAPVTYPAEPKD